MALSEKLTFHNTDDVRLDAVLELPDDMAYHYALYAHCFTCSKEIAAAVRVSRALAALGVGTLRFDFAGLGKSEGDFSDTTFSSNISDLLSAAEFLRENYRAPTLLIGHSLGGAAVLAAAGDIPELKGVVTVGAPAEPEHVAHLFESEIEKICEIGKAEVDLAGRKFMISKGFVDDIHRFDLKGKLKALSIPLLIMHSPVDATVPVEEAAKIYRAANHPKSYIALDGADHLLSKKEDAEYVSGLIAAWSSKYCPEPEVS